MRSILKEKNNKTCRLFQFCNRKSQTTAKMTMRNPVKLIEYQIQAHCQNNCTVLITKDQSSKVCNHFSIFGLFVLISLSCSSSKEYRMRHCVENRHGWNIVNLKNPRHALVSQHLRKIQTEFHRNSQNFDTLLIHVFDWMTLSHFCGHLQFSVCGIKKNSNSSYFLEIYIYWPF